jgi:hypothetical protein
MGWKGVFKKMPGHSLIDADNEVCIYMYTFGVFDQQHPEMIESHAELHHAEIF